ncbi:hypothetical protein F5882DRAFT_377229 [Hyaloscypha sp. PMI_1271]|nr:hypothetical protein F5882DRAFT_377229 [Hyaloscypha sp. PMI_1271]
MSAPPQCLTLSGACDAPRLTSDIHPHLPISRPCDEEHSISKRDAVIYSQRHHREQESPLQILCRAATGLSSKQSLNGSFEGFVGNDATFPGNTMGYYSTKDLFSRASINQPTGRDANIGRTDVEVLIRYPEGSHGTAPPLEAQPRVLGTLVLRMRSGAGSSAAVPRMSMEKALEVPGNARPSKRRWEQESNLTTRDNQTKSSDHTQYSKKAKVDCDYDTDHSWWMTVKISDLNKVLQRIHAAIGLVGKLAYKLEDLDEIAVGNLVDLLKDSQGILKSAKDDMIEEGGTDRECLE